MTAVGYQALMTATTATNDDALGYQAGLYITTGSSNMAIGDYAMQGVSVTPLTGNGYNTALGDSALVNVQGAATQNTAVGYNALDKATIAQPQHRHRL